MLSQGAVGDQGVESENIQEVCVSLFLLKEKQRKMEMSWFVNTFRDAGKME